VSFIDENRRTMRLGNIQQFRKVRQVPVHRIQALKKHEPPFAFMLAKAFS
jgi:hypothetical protein